MDRDGLTVVPEAAPVYLREPAAPEGEPPGDARSRRGSFRALHSRPFRLYFAGQVASDTRTIKQLGSYKGLDARWTSWDNVTGVCRALAAEMTR
jgi:hypothetical protein